MNLESFKEAFYTGAGSCRGLCKCGVQFYDSEGGYAWEDGELDNLRSTPGSREIDCSVGFVAFGGVEYVYQCNCWYKKAEKVMNFIDSHSHAIIQYLLYEKTRRQAEVDNMPTIKD